MSDPDSEKDFGSDRIQIPNTGKDNGNFCNIGAVPVPVVGQGLDVGITQELNKSTGIYILQDHTRHYRMNAGQDQQI